jgi:dihydrofolate reductase
MLRRILETRAPDAVWLVRLAVAIVFVSEGIQKFLYPAALGAGRFAKIGIPAPEVLGPFNGIVEIGCGALRQHERAGADGQRAQQQRGGRPRARQVEHREHQHPGHQRLHDELQRDDRQDHAGAPRAAALCPRARARARAQLAVLREEQPDRHQRARAGRAAEQAGEAQQRLRPRDVRDREQPAQRRRHQQGVARQRRRRLRDRAARGAPRLQSDLDQRQRQAEQQARRQDRRQDRRLQPGPPEHRQAEGNAHETGVGVRRRQRLDAGVGEGRRAPPAAPARQRDPGDERRQHAEGDGRHERRLVQLRPARLGQRLEQQRRQRQPDHEQVEAGDGLRAEHAAPPAHVPGEDQREQRQHRLDNQLHQVLVISRTLTPMRPLRYSINVTLDGCCDHRAIPADEELHRHAAETLAQADALIFGRVIYEMMEAAWRPPALDALPDWMKPFGRTIDAAKKYVVSNTLARVDWNAELLRGDLATAVEQLKRQPGNGLLVGGVKLPLALTELGLIDEYELIVHPRLAGHGPALFAGLSKHVDLKLVSRRELASGAVALRYEPRREPPGHE